MDRTTANQLRELGLRTVLVMLSLVVLFAAAEFSIRLYGVAKQVIRPESAKTPGKLPIRLDQKLGWQTTENFVQQHATGSQAIVRYSTTRDGFREYGDASTLKIKMLVIGDSFTEAPQVSNENTYYRVLAGMFPIEIFAYGGGGYGSLQEYMILDEHIDRIRPDIVLWQFSSNDLVNNSEELERASYFNNNGMRRPYLGEDGTIYYANPKPAAFVRDFANNYSRFLYLILSRWDILKARLAGGEAKRLFESVEIVIGRERGQHPGFQRAIRTTAEIMKRVSARAGSARTVAFISDCQEEFCDALEGIAQRERLEFIPGIPDSVRAAEREGVVTRAADGAHWNEMGHSIVGRIIADYFRTHGISRVGK